MKKFLAALLALSMILSLGACTTKPSVDDPTTNPSTPADPTTPATDPTPVQVSNDPVKIGVIFYSKDDSLGQLVYSYLNYAAEVIDNLEVQWVFGSFDAASQLADAENLISAGVDGILCLTLDDVAMLQIAKLCNDNEVFFQVMFRAPSSEETKAMLATYDYYVGYAIEDTVSTSHETIHILSENGVKNIAVGGNTHSATSLLRMEGMHNGCQDYGVNIVTEFDIGTDVTSIQSDVQNILDSYPDVEAVWSMSGSLGIADIIVNTLRAHKEATGKTVGFVTFDTFDGMSQALEDGFLYGAVSGQAPLCLQAFAALFNAIDGHPLSADKLELFFPFLIITSPDDLQLMEQYYNNTSVQLYDEEVIKSMLYRYNTDVKLDELVTFWSSFSMDWIKDEMATR